MYKYRELSGSFAIENVWCMYSIYINICIYMYISMYVILTCCVCVCVCVGVERVLPAQDCGSHES